MFDRLIDERLREARFVGFVVAPAAEAVHVDEDIALESGAEIHRQFDHLSDGLRVFAVHVEDRHRQHFCHVRLHRCLSGLLLGRW